MLFFTCLAVGGVFLLLQDSTSKFGMDAALLGTAVLMLGEVF